MTRERGGTTRQRDNHEEDAVSSAAEIGRLLRDAREERGLDLLAVHDRLNRPITQLEALENGNLVSLPDQALALSTLRRYAAFLNLDGDVLALRMIDAWSAIPPPPGPTGSVTNVVAAVSTGPDHLLAFTQTGQVPRVGGGSTAAAGGYGYDVATGPPTGTFPVVPKQDLRHSKRSVARARRRLRAPTTLKVVTWSAAVLLVVVLVGFGILQRKPQWLATAHILRVVETGPTTTSTAASASGQARTVVQTSTDLQTSSYSVGSSAFLVSLTTSGPCWIQITSSDSSAPLVSGVQPAGKRITVPASGTMTVQVGSSAVVVGIAVDGKLAFLNAPHTTPYTYTFAPATHA